MHLRGSYDGFLKGSFPKRVKSKRSQCPLHPQDDPGFARRIVFTMPSLIHARIFSPIELQGDQHEGKRDFLGIAKCDLTRFENERLNSRLDWIFETFFP